MIAALQASEVLEATYPGMAKNDITCAVIAALAQKGRSPFIGVHCGTKTVLIKREVFKKSLAGLKITHAELVESDGNGIRGTFRKLETIRKPFPQPDEQILGKPIVYAAGYALRVFAAAGKVKATRLFLGQNPKAYENRKLIEAWKTAELKRRLPNGQKMNKYQKQIQKLDKQLKALRPLKRPANPAVCTRRVDSSAWGTPATYEMVPFSEGERESDYTRNQEYLWYSQRKTRQEIMALARRGKKDLNSTKLYEKLAKLMVLRQVELNSAERMAALNSGERPLPEAIYGYQLKPLTFKKWGEITERERERKCLEDIWDYLNRLWEFCGLQVKPYRSKEDRQLWGPSRYYEWQSERNARREIELTIAALNIERFR